MTKVRLCAICFWRVMATVIGGWLLLVAFAMGYEACELNKWRMARARAEAGVRTVVYSEDGTPVFGGDLGPTAMWLCVGGKRIMLEPKWLHIAVHGAISVLTFAAGGGLLWLTFRCGWGTRGKVCRR